MTHLSPDEFVDALEGALDPGRQAHIDACEACGLEMARFRSVLRDTQDVSVPEPSPLFWEHFSSRVQTAIADENTPRTSWVPMWLRWRVLAPLGALALLVLALATALPRQPAAPVVATSVEEGSTPAVDLAAFGEQEWGVVAEIVGPVDLDAAEGAGIVRLGAAERAALQLSVAERRELIRLLQEEIDKVGG